MTEPTATTEPSESDDEPGGAFVCPNCQTRPKPRARFCVRCGTQLPVATADSQPPDDDEPQQEPRQEPRQERRSDRLRDRHRPSRNTGRPELQVGSELWMILRPALVLFALLLGSSLVASWSSIGLGDESPTIDAWMTAVGAVVILVYAYMDRNALRRLFIGQWVTATSMLLIPGILLVMFVFMSGYFWVLESVLGVEAYDYSESFRVHGWPIWSAFLLVSICPAVFEELAVRGVIMVRLERVMKPNEALILQSALFSILHLIPAIFISHFFMGLALGWARMKTGSLYPGMIVHALWNAMVLAQDYANVPS